MKIAIIPARGGSKRIPDKNIRPFCGKPMIAHSIIAAQKAECFDHIIVSTDSPKIARLATQWGAEVPFLRPACLADDHTPTAPVITHAITALRNIGITASYACLIYATAPLLQPSFLTDGLMALRDNKAAAALSVTSFPYPIQRALRITSKGLLQMIHPEYEMARSNDLEETFHDAGQFCWLSVEQFLHSGRIPYGSIYPIILPRHLVQDIDTPEDWVSAEFIYKALHQTNNTQTQHAS